MGACQMKMKLQYLVVTLAFFALVAEVEGGNGCTECKLQKYGLEHCCPGWGNCGHVARNWLEQVANKANDLGCSKPDKPKKCCECGAKRLFDCAVSYCPDFGSIYWRGSNPCNSHGWMTNLLSINSTAIIEEADDSVPDDFIALIESSTTEQDTHTATAGWSCG